MCVLFEVKLPLTKRRFVSDLEKAADDLGLERVVREEHRPNQRPELAEELKTWYLQAMTALNLPVWRRTGQTKTEEEAAKMLGDMEKKVWKTYGEGVVPDMPIVSLIFRKP
jgi:hypothetical protein